MKAERVFADRQNEWTAVAHSIQTVVAANQASGFDVEDMESPRRNVLAFYGVGGIGKSELTRRIVGHLDDDEDTPGADQWSDSEPGWGRIVPVRLDLSPQFGHDFESIMLSLRVAVAALAHPMIAFDLAFGRYWEHNHPNESLDEYLEHQSAFSRATSALAVPQQIRSAIEDVSEALLLPGTVGAVVGQTVSAVAKALRDHRREVRALAGCRRLADLLEAAPDQDALSYYAHLLAWDLSQLPPKRAASLVVILDTFEEIGDRTHRDLERLIQRMVWLMPNTLFIVAGRNRLQWDDPRLEGQLDWVGSRCWPLLAPGATEEPRQHRVGYLSAQDSERYLCRRLTVDSQPLMDESTRQAIISHSHGLPLYLDLAVMRFLDLYRQSGKSPAVAEFTFDFPALVARTFRDLTPPERYVLRAVSLLDSFSISLASASAGLSHDGAVLALIDRPFIDTDRTTAWPYSVHDLIRSVIRDADETTEDRWSEQDWLRAANRIVDALGVEYRHARNARQRARAFSCLRQGLRLTRDFNLPLGWLTDAAYDYVADMVWEPIELPAGAEPPALDSPAAALAGALTAIARRQRQHRSHTADALREVLDSNQLPEPLRELPAYFLAECRRDLGRFSESLAGMRHVSALGGRMAPDARRGLVHLARRIGQFPDAQTAVEALGPEGHQHRTTGDLWWPHGKISTACAFYARARDEAAQNNQPGEAALSQACLAFAAAFEDRGRAEEQIEHARTLLAGISMRWAEFQVRNAELLRDAGHDPTLPDRVAAVVEEGEAAGLTSSVAYARFAGCFHAAIIQGDPEVTEQAINSLQRSVHGVEFAYLLELSVMMSGHNLDADLPRAEWLDSPEHTQQRWRQLIDNRRRELQLSTGD